MADYGDAVKARYSKGNGMNTEYYRLGNIGWWLAIQRQIAGMTRTQVADDMRFPRGAIKDIEEGRRIPQGKTVAKYLSALGVSKVLDYGDRRDMYARFHR